MRCRYSGPLSFFSSPGLLMKEISAKIEGIFAPISTTNGAFLTPRSRIPALFADSPLCSDCWTSDANSLDSSIFSLSAIFLTRSCSSWMSLSDAAFSRAATSNASGEEVSFKRNEGVITAREHDIRAKTSFQKFTEAPAHIEHQVLFQ